MKDKFSDDQPSKPAAGGDTSRHAGKDNQSSPNCGGTPHPEKAKYDEAHGRAGLSQPSQGYTAHPAKADGVNRQEPLSNPQGSEPIVKENLHSDKQKKQRDRDRHVEPKPKGDSDSSGRPSKSTKVD